MSSKPTPWNPRYVASEPVNAGVSPGTGNSVTSFPRTLTCLTNVVVVVVDVVVEVTVDVVVAGTIVLVVEGTVGTGTNT